MANRQNPVPIYIGIGILIFALGRCSADAPKAPADQPVALLSADNSLSNEAGDASEVSAFADEAASSPDPVEAPVSEPEEPEQLAQPSSSGRACGSKHLCRQMDSCEEAYHYLNDCGVSRLDGDGDGVPCESICG